VSTATAAVMAATAPIMAAIAIAAAMTAAVAITVEAETPWHKIYPYRLRKRPAQSLHASSLVPKPHSFRPRTQGSKLDYHVDGPGQQQSTPGCQNRLP
jgi:hypothetical protein